MRTRHLPAILSAVRDGQHFQRPLAPNNEYPNRFRCPKPIARRSRTSALRNFMSFSSSLPSSADVSPLVGVVTGGSRGIGLAVTHSFLSQGMVVYTLDVVPPEDSVSQRAMSTEQLTHLDVDVSDPTDLTAGLERAYERHRRLDCLVNNAAIYECEENRNVIWDDGTTDDEVDRILRTNLGGVVHGTRAAFRLMKRARPSPSSAANSDSNSTSGGTVVNVASTGALGPTPGRAVYGATKAGILHFTRSADLDLRRDGVRVFCVCPGIVDTEMGHMGGERNRRAVAKLKGGKRTRPELVAEAVLGLVQRRKEWTDCSYLRVDNHKITCCP